MKNKKTEQIGGITKKAVSAKVKTQSGPQRWRRKQKDLGKRSRETSKRRSGNNGKGNLARPRSLREKNH